MQILIQRSLRVFSLLQPTAIALLVVAMFASACADSVGGELDTTIVDPSFDEATNDEANIANPVGDVDLGDLEASYGAGSAAAQAASRFPSEDELGADWVLTPIPTSPEPPGCASKAIAGANRFYQELDPDALDRGFASQLVIAVEIFDSPAAALDGAGFVDTPDYRTCIEESLKAADLGPFTLASDDFAGVEIDSLVELPGARTFLSAAQLRGPGFAVDLENRSTVWVSDSILFVVDLTEAAGEASATTTIAAEALMSDPPVLVGGPDALDAAVNGLRAAILTDGPGSVFTISAPAVLSTSTSSTIVECSTGFPDGEGLDLEGPTWFTSSGASGAIQLGQWFPTAEAAAAELRRLEADAPTCLAEQTASGIGEITIDTATSDTIDVDGVEIVIVDVGMTQLASNPGVGIDADIAALGAMTRSGQHLVGWGFIGFRGDEPDLVALTLESLRQLEAQR